MRIRILGIDTLETWQPRCENELQLGLKAKERLEELLDGAKVTYESTTQHEHWGRVLAYVYADHVRTARRSPARR